MGSIHLEVGVPISSRSGLRGILIKVMNTIKALRPLFGSVIGVGLFGLPYIVAQVGFGVGVFVLLFSGVLGTVMMLLYADIALYTKGHARFVGLVREHAGPVVGFVAAVAFFGSLYGAIVAYILVGGTFAHIALSPFFGGTILFYRVLFFLVSAIGVLGGALTVAKLQKYFIGVYVLLIVVLAAIAVPSIDVQHFFGGYVHQLWTAFGVALFAFIGFGAIPEMRDILGRERYALRRVVLIGMALVFLLYLVFVAAVVGVTGSATSPEALRGLAAFFGNTFLFFGGAVGLCTVFVATITQTLTVTNTWVYDYRVRYLVGCALALGIPLFIFLFGVSDYIHVIAVTGGVGGGVTGLCCITAYEKLRAHPTTAKRMLAIPQWVVFLTACAFLANIVFAVW